MATKTANKFKPDISLEPCQHLIETIAEHAEENSTIADLVDIMAREFPSFLSEYLKNPKNKKGYPHLNCKDEKALAITITACDEINDAQALSDKLNEDHLIAASHFTAYYIDKILNAAAEEEEPEQPEQVGKPTEEATETTPESTPGVQNLEGILDRMKTLEAQIKAVNAKIDEMHGVIMAFKEAIEIRISPGSAE